MAAKTLILKPTTFSDFASLFRFLRTGELRRLFSIRQCETLADVIDASLPADVSLEQRTPKGAVYVYVDGAPFGTVNQSGRYLAPAGPGALGAPLTRINLPKRSGM